MEGQVTGSPREQQPVADPTDIEMGPGCPAVPVTVVVCEGSRRAQAICPCDGE